MERMKADVISPSPARKWYTAMTSSTTIGARPRKCALGHWKAHKCHLILGLLRYWDELFQVCVDLWRRTSSSKKKRVSPELAHDGSAPFSPTPFLLVLPIFAPVASCHHHPWMQCYLVISCVICFFYLGLGMYKWCPALVRLVELVSKWETTVFAFRFPPLVAGRGRTLRSVLLEIFDPVRANEILKLITNPEMIRRERDRERNC